MAEQNTTTPERSCVHLAARRRLDTAYADWLMARAEVANPNIPDDDDRFLDEKTEEESDAVCRIVGLPAVLEFHVFQKFEVLEAYLPEIDDRWTDKRVTRLISSIKADLLHLKIGGRD